MALLRKMWFILPIFRVQYLKKGIIRTTKRHATGTTNTSVASSLLAKMHADIETIKEKIKALFELWNSKK
jgi:hypothetical protein